MGHESLIVACDRAMTRICCQMLVSIIRHVIGFQHCRVIFQYDVVEQFGKFDVARIFTFVAEDVGGVVHLDMDVAIAVEVTCLLVEMCAVAVEIRRVLTQNHVSDKAFHVLSIRFIV